MPTLLAPALRGNDPLGFLAALGVLSLSELGEIEPVALRWEGGLVPIAAFETDHYGDLAALASALADVAERLKAKDAVIPGAPPAFPYHVRRPEDDANGVDPMRMSRAAARATYRDAAAEWQKGNPWFARWLIAILAQWAADGKDTTRLTPFNAPFGQMKFRDSYFVQSRDGVLRWKSAGAPADAFAGWIRERGFTGANLDERAIREAALTTNGQPNNTGAPSPTWLAVMAIRFFPMADDGTRTRTVGWQEARLYEGATTRSLIWPTWSPTLDPPAVRALLAHPELAITRRGRGWAPAHPGRLRALGITALYGTSRRTRTQGDGPLGHAICLWSNAQRRA